MVRAQDLKNKLINKYRDIGSIWCPAFQAPVHFTMKGWRHILGSEPTQTRRKTSEVITRLRLVLACPMILGRATTSSYRRQNNRDYYACTCVHEGETVMIVIEKDIKQIYRFHSVFLKKRQ